MPTRYPPESIQDIIVSPCAATKSGLKVRGKTGGGRMIEQLRGAKE